MKVLYCVSEVAPLIKVGGLGDVAGSLPKALARLGVDIRIIVPKYEEMRINELGIKKLEELTVNFAGQAEKTLVWQTTLPNSQVPVYLLENNTYLSQDGHSAFAGTVNEIERFAFFSKAIATFFPPAGRAGNFQWDLLHFNDWHTSLVPLLLLPDSPPALLTIHNLSYQGIAPVDLLAKLGLSEQSCRTLKWDAENRDIDILMEGIIHASFVNTVSPTYAKEIMTPEYGWGIEEVLRGKEGRIVGILNGIDNEIWNPETDEKISIKYSVLSSKYGKIENKKLLQKQLGLAVDENLPLLAFIGRLEPKQKGLDILYEAMDKLLLEKTFQFILLGTGDKEWEEKFRVQSLKFRTKMVFINKFDERLAHQIYAGADFILVPSKFEPCGLPQMIGMRYGALPIVRKTGGLADTVVDNKTGFVFEEYSRDALTKVIERAMEQWSKGASWHQLIEKAMKEDFSWERSAKEYLVLYKRLLEKL